MGLEFGQKNWLGYGIWAKHWQDPPKAIRFESRDFSRAFPLARVFPWFCLLVFLRHNHFQRFFHSLLLSFLLLG